jgi:hypothetical protein
MSAEMTDPSEPAVNGSGLPESLSVALADRYRIEREFGSGGKSPPGRTPDRRE